MNTELKEPKNDFEGNFFNLISSQFFEENM